ncbi:MAG: hypothetical protein ACK5TZ_00560, partial [bacterium]
MTILLLASTVGAGAAVQEQKPTDTQSPEAVVRIDTELVQIDVVVEDEKGQLVRTLKREDFQLTEDGKVQSLSFFSVGTAARPARWLKSGR